MKNGTAIGVNANDEIFYCKGYYGNWNLIDGKLTNVCLDNDESIWGVNRAGEIFYRKGFKKGEW